MYKTIWSLYVLLFISCTNQVKLSELTLSSNMPIELKALENQDSILVYYEKKLFSGKAFDYYKDGGTKSIIDFRKGLIHGTVNNFYENGNPQVIIHALKGLYNGPVKVYYADGNLKEKGNFLNGLQNGENTRFHQNGLIAFTRKFDENGMGVGKWSQYDSLGRIIGYINMKNNFENGPSEILKYSSSGNIIERTFLNYTNGQLEGKAYKLGEKSDTVFSEVYVNGNLEGAAKVVINEKGDYMISNYVAGVRKSNGILFDKFGKKIVKHPLNRIQNKETLNPTVSKENRKSHVCNYCGKSFAWEGFYLAGTREGISMRRSHNDNQELCCSSLCAHRIMGM